MSNHFRSIALNFAVSLSFFSILPLFTPTASFAQNPDLTGRWLLNELESRTPDDGRTDGIRTYIPASEITITVDGKEITFESRLSNRSSSSRSGRRVSTNIRSYIVDGVLHTTVTDGDTIKTRTEWKEDRLVINSERIIYMGIRKRVFTGRREYYLSDEGKKLIMEDEIRNPDGGLTKARIVYDRVQGRMMQTRL